MSYYEILGIDKNATIQEIKRAYRNKSKEFHPDSGGSEEEFVSIKKAFDCLSDSERREVYDETGQDLGLKELITYTIKTFIDKAIDSGLTGNFVDLMLRESEIQKSKTTKEIEFLRKKINILERESKNIESDGENLFRNSMEQLIEESLSFVKQKEFQIKKVNALIKEVKRHSERKRIGRGSMIDILKGG